MKGRRDPVGKKKAARKPAGKPKAARRAARAPLKPMGGAAAPVPRGMPKTVVAFGKKAPPVPRFRPEVAEVVSRILAELPGVTSRPMFGLPAWYAGDKLFACVYGEGVGLRFNERRARQLKTVTGFFPFRPYGRAETKGWVSLVRDIPGQYVAYRSLFVESAACAQGQGTRGKPGKKAGKVETRRRAAR